MLSKECPPCTGYGVGHIYIYMGKHNSNRIINNIEYNFSNGKIIVLFHDMTNKSQRLCLMSN